MEGEGQRKREAWICCSTYLCIQWLILLCALTWMEPATLTYSDDALPNLATWQEPDHSLSSTDPSSSFKDQAGCDHSSSYSELKDF